jgi:hypothetical protein
LKSCLNQRWFQIKILEILYIKINQKNYRFQVQILLKKCWNAIQFLRCILTQLIQTRFQPNFNMLRCTNTVEKMLKCYSYCIRFPCQISTSWYGLGFNTISTWNWVEILSNSTLISNQNTGGIIDQNQPQKLQISSANLVEQLSKSYSVSTLHFNTVHLD